MDTLPEVGVIAARPGVSERRRADLAPALRINFAQPPLGAASGISRYCVELKRSLSALVEFRPCRVSAGALAGVPLLRNLPLGVAGLDPAAPLHLPQISGAGVLRLRRLPPTLVTVHDLGFLELPEEQRMFSAVARVLLRLSFSALRDAAAIVAVSEFTRASVVRRLRIPIERVHVVYEGVDRKVFRPRDDARRLAQSRLGIHDWDDWKTLLVVGTELPRKRLDLVLEILAAYRRRGEPVRLVKAGGAGGAAFRARFLHTAARLDVTDRVHLLDALTDDDLSLLYSAADAYVCASQLEGFSLPTAEALACGAPAVVADGGALREVAGGAAVVVPEWTPRAWMTALNSVVGDSGLRARLRDAGIARAQAFDWDEAGRRTLALYQELSATSTKTKAQALGD